MRFWYLLISKLESPLLVPLQVKLATIPILESSIERQLLRLWKPDSRTVPPWNVPYWERRLNRSRPQVPPILIKSKEWYSAVIRDKSNSLIRESISMKLRSRELRRLLLRTRCRLQSTWSMTASRTEAAEVQSPPVSYKEPLRSNPRCMGPSLNQESQSRSRLGALFQYPLNSHHKQSL